MQGDNNEKFGTTDPKLRKIRESIANGDVVIYGWRCGQFLYAYDLDNLPEE